MVSEPRALNYSQEFQYPTLSISLFLSTGFTYNTLFAVKSFHLFILKKNFTLNLSTEESSITSDYRGYEKIHTRKVEGLANIFITNDWTNETIVAQVIAQVNSQVFKYESPQFYVDYYSMLNASYLTPSMAKFSFSFILFSIHSCSLRLFLHCSCNTVIGSCLNHA